ncbi:hypothetical protein, partial [Geobacillus kaustophilus]|uniref:hypothetical protein n=1 Tax=Geobacillus kaustophilus TaxID=1462 RepID=UPI000696AADF
SRKMDKPLFRQGYVKLFRRIYIVCGGVFMEQWERWEPITDIPPSIYNDMLLNGKEGIVLKFSDGSHRREVIITFEEGVLSYRNDEGSLLKMLTYLDQHYGTNFYNNWPLLKVKNSAYLKWFHEER